MKLPVASGQQLITDFQSAIMTIATSEAAQHEAQATENALVEHLRTISHGNYLQPGALGVDNPDAISRASLDAHIKKVQADQITNMSAAQLQALQAQAQQLYRGHRVRITVITAGSQPIESVWFDSRNGYRTNPTRRQTVSGIIEEISFDQNIIVLKPTAVTRLMSSGLTNFVVYVIDLATMTPMIDVTIE